MTIMSMVRESLGDGDEEEEEEEGGERDIKGAIMNVGSRRSTVVTEIK